MAAAVAPDGLCASRATNPLRSRLIPRHRGQERTYLADKPPLAARADRHGMHGRFPQGVTERRIRTVALRSQTSHHSMKGKNQEARSTSRARHRRASHVGRGSNPLGDGYPIGGTGQDRSRHFTKGRIQAGVCRRQQPLSAGHPAGGQGHRERAAGGRNDARVGRHDVTPGSGCVGNGHLVLTTNEGDAAYLKFQHRGISVPGPDGKPQNLIHGFWEGAASTGKRKGLRGAGTSHVNAVSPKERQRILEGDFVQVIETQRS